MTESKGAVTKIAELIRDIRIANLTTVDENGRLKSRPMATQEQDFEGKLWFLTYDESPKTGEIDHARQVNVSYANPQEQRYVSISGTARVSHDRMRIKELWRPVLKAWFPKGEEDPRIAVIEVDAEEAEYWDSPSSTFVKVAGLAKSLVTGKPYMPGENMRVDLKTGETTDLKPGNEERAKRDNAA